MANDPGTSSHYHFLTHCVVCGQDSFSRVYEGSFKGSKEEASKYFLTDRAEAVHGSVWKCDRCGFVFTNPQFDRGTYKATYRSIETKPRSDMGSRRRFELLARQVRRHSSRGRLLDLGCGDGSFLTAMSGFETIGVDINPVSSLSEQSPAIVHGDLLDVMHDRQAEWAGRFDAVTAWDVLEHIPGIEECLEAIQSILKPGGLLFCTLPNVASWVARLSGRRWNLLLLEHLWYFSPETFTKLVQRFSFSVLETKGFHYPVDLLTVLRRLDQTYGLRLSHRGLGRIGRTVVDLPIGMMLAVCRKDGPDGT